MTDLREKVTQILFEFERGDSLFSWEKARNETAERIIALIRPAILEECAVFVAGFHHATSSEVIARHIRALAEKP